MSVEGKCGSKGPQEAEGPMILFFTWYLGCFGALLLSPCVLTVLVPWETWSLLLFGLFLQLVGIMISENSQIVCHLQMCQRYSFKASCKK